MSSLRKNHPVRNGSTKYTTKPPTGLPEFEMLHPSGKNNGFVIAITEATPTATEPAPAPQEAQVATAQAQRPRPQPPPLTIPQKAHITDDQRPTTPPTHQSPPPPPPPPPTNCAPSAADAALPRSSTSSPTLVRSGSTATATPVMHSMFPKYNPSVPLGHQHYYPNVERVPGLASAMAVAGSSSNGTSGYSQHIRGATKLDRTGGDDGKPGVAELKESPFNNSNDSKHVATLSTPEELLELWAIGNGQAASEEAAETYTLELSCDDLAIGQEIITFSSSSSDAFYTLEASNDNLTISRTHPPNRNPTIQITSSILSQPSSADPLVTSIFPKLAGLMALDQSSNVAVAHRLDRKASANLQAEAVSRAQEQEASMLLWDNDSDKYCLMHPTLLDSCATTLPIEIVPKPSNPQKITIFAPETGTPLLTLSLTSLALTIHTPTIAALPSLYILDTLMTTLLTLLLHLHRSCGRPSSRHVSTSPTMPLFPPPPTLAYKGSQASLRKPRSLSRVSIFRSNKSMRSNRSLRTPSAYDQDIEMQSLPAISATSEKDGKHKPPKQIFSTDDEGLPKATRAVLKVLYWIFEVVFWFMGVVVQVLAAGIVGAGKLITKL